MNQIFRGFCPEKFYYNTDIAQSIDNFIKGSHESSLVKVYCDVESRRNHSKMYNTEVFLVKNRYRNLCFEVEIYSPGRLLYVSDNTFQSEGDCVYSFYSDKYN